MTRTSFRTADEQGIALVIAITILLVLSLLGAAVLAQAVSFSRQSNANRDRQRALSAAETGLAVARYRLNMLRPADSACLTDVAVAPGTGAASGECPAYAGSLGNGATYSYTVTQLQPNSSTECGPAAATGAYQRCITATGTIGGISRRVQTRVDSHLVGSPVFPVQGALGIDHVTIGNSNAGSPNLITAALASNGTIAIGNNVNVSGGCLLAPGGTITSIGNGSTCPIVNEPQKFAVTPPASISVAGNTFANTTTNNANVSAGSAYVTSGRVLQVTSNLTLPSGVYNFCSIIVAKNVTLSFAAGAQVTVFLDSPARAGSGCPAGSGTMKVSGSIVNNIANTPPSLQLYVYGSQTTQGTKDIILAQNTTITATLYAPNSVMSTTNSLSWNGAIVLWAIDIKNALHLNTDPSSSTILTNASLTVFRSGNWRECHSAPTTVSDPQSGCI